MSRLSKVLRRVGVLTPRAAPRTPALSREVLARLETPELAELRVRFGEAKWAKYLDLEKYVPVAVGICDQLGLIDATPKRILDIGCGTGLFLRCAMHFGHSGIGLDIEDEMQAEMAALFGVDRRVQPVRTNESIRIDGPFDLITAMGTQFDRQARSNGGPHYWGPKEWRFFLADIETKLSPGGRVFLRINRSNDARDRNRNYYDEAVHRSLRHGHRRGIAYLFDRQGLALAIENLGEEQPTTSSTYGAGLDA